jgi:hypothetical protein
MSSYESKISEFRSKIADIGRQLAELGNRRRSYSLAAVEGDSAARKQIADIDFETDELRKQEGTLASAIETAAALDRRREADAAAALSHDKQVEAYGLARGVVTLNEEIDLALKRLREMLERRASLLNQLAATELVDATLTTRLASKAPLTRACCAAGLHRFIQVETVSPQAMIPLADGNAQLLGIGESPNDKASDKPDKPRNNSRVNTRH